MRDHNSLSIVMGDVYTSFLVDIHQFHHIDVTAEVRRVRQILHTSGTQGLLRFLQKHHLVLMGFFKHGLVKSADVRADASGYPVFLNALWHGLHSEDAVLCAADLRQATSLLRKWAEEDVSAEDAITAFKSRMSIRKDACYSLVDRISAHLWRIIGNDDYSIDESWPAVTSGARAERTPILQRIDLLQWVPHPEVLRRDGFTICGWGRKRQNRLVAVPKDWSKPRLVFAEPTPSMNLQQMLRLWLESKVRCHSDRISFDDQDKQRERLRRANSASIDLTDASDHLTSAVIWRFFRKYPVLRSALFWARSQSTMVGDEPVTLKCFGTMGNATTFPVMSIFLACLACEAEKHCRQYAQYAAYRSTVFGDDIVCDDVIAGTVLEMLRDVGLVPNGAKTFIATRFRESCGLDLFDEVDITPIYVKRVVPTCAADAGRLLDYSNAAHKRGYWHLADRLAQLIGRPLSVNVDEWSLMSFSRGINPIACYWDCDTQRWVSRLAPRSKNRVASRDSHLDLAYALFHGHRITEARKS